MYYCVLRGNNFEYIDNLCTWGTPNHDVTSLPHNLPVACCKENTTPVTE